MNDAVEKAISAVGSAVVLAAGQWRRVPAERVLEVERLTGVSRHELRPDLYPPPIEAPSPHGEAAE